MSWDSAWRRARYRWIYSSISGRGMIVSLLGRIADAEEHVEIIFESDDGMGG